MKEYWWWRVLVVEGTGSEGVLAAEGTGSGGVLVVETVVVVETVRTLTGWW